MTRDRVSQQGCSDEEEVVFRDALQLPPAKELESKVKSMTLPELQAVAQDLVLTNVGTQAYQQGAEE